MENKEPKRNIHQGWLLELALWFVIMFSVVFILESNSFWLSLIFSVVAFISFRYYGWLRRLGKIL